MTGQSDQKIIVGTQSKHAEGSIYVSRIAGADAVVLCTSSPSKLYQTEIAVAYESSPRDSLSSRIQLKAPLPLADVVSTNVTPHGHRENERVRTRATRKLHRADMTLGAVDHSHLHDHHARLLGTPRHRTPTGVRQEEILRDPIITTDPGGDHP